MERNFWRVQRISQEIKKEISIILHRKIKDTRVKNALISGVEISRDLSYAKIYVTFLNILDKKYETEIIKNNIKILNGDMAKCIRSLLCKAMCLRIIPEITFFYDRSLLEGIHVSNLLSKVIRDDEKRHYTTKNK
ncbi:MAG: 30S ribosome-binding factor RbfA [Arsenophonus sp.]